MIFGFGLGLAASLFIILASVNMTKSQVMCNDTFNVCVDPD